MARLYQGKSEVNARTHSEGSDLVRAGHDSAILISDIEPGLERNTQLLLSSHAQDMASFYKTMWKGN